MKVNKSVDIRRSFSNQRILNRPISGGCILAFSVTDYVSLSAVHATEPLHDNFRFGSFRFVIGHEGIITYTQFIHKFVHLLIPCFLFFFFFCNLLISQWVAFFYFLRTWCLGPKASYKKYFKNQFRQVELLTTR